MVPSRRVHPLVGAFVSLALFGVVLVAGLLGAESGAGGDAESVRTFADLDCAAAAPRVDVTLANATAPVGGHVNATVTLANAAAQPLPVRVDTVTVGVHALTATGALDHVTDTTRAVPRAPAVAARAHVLAPGALVTLVDMGVPRATWNGTDAAGAAVAPGVYVMTVHLNAAPGAACGERVLGYQVFEVRAPGAGGPEAQAPPPQKP